MKMKILGKTIQMTGSEPEQKPEPKQKGLSDTLGGFLDFFRKPLSDEKQISDKLIKSNEEWVFVNVSTLAEVISQLEFQLFQFKMVQGNVELEEIDQHELLDLLDKFNESTTKEDAIYNTSAHIELTGDSFWLLEGGRGNKKPEKIYLLQPDNVNLKLGDFTKESRRIIDAYEYKVTIDQKTIERSYDPSEIIHTKAPNPANPYRGKSVVEAMATTIDTDNFAQEALKNLFKNGMVGDFFLTTEKKATPEQLKRLAAQFKAAYTGVRNFWKVPILYGGIKPEKLMSTGREMQLIELEEWFRNKIMSAFKNTRASLGIDDEVNRSTAEASLSNWKRSVIAPKMARIVNSLNEYLVPRYGENLILTFKDPVPEDKAAKIEEANKLFESGLITKNEARQIIDYDEVEGGDDFKVSLNPAANNFERQLKSKLPSFKYIDFKKVFRKAGVYQKSKDYRIAYTQARPIAEKIVKNRKKRKDNGHQREHAKFSNEQVWNYWSKQIDIVEDVENIFENVAEQYVGFVVEEALSGLETKKIEVNKDELLERAVNQFTPSLNEVVILSGQVANRLIGTDDPYIPTKAVNTREAIREQILLFAGSMLSTDIDYMTNVLADGLKGGLSIAKIRKQIQDQFFGTGRRAKNQAERITRTEVIKASNLGAQDAFEQSGVVVAKQWLTAEDDRVDPLCSSMNGKIIDLKGKFFNKGDTISAGGKSQTLSYSDTPYPPLHPNCRCTLLPIVEGQEDFDIRSFEQFQDLRLKIKELEENVDKRTKEFKQAKKDLEEKDKSEAEMKEYVEKLETIAGLGNEK